MWKYNRQSGFTLVELAIVLVIIGLLLGGLLKGQEMIQNGKIKNLKNDVHGITAAYYAYRDRYNALPGDDPRAAARWSTASPLPMVGTGDGIVGTINEWTSCTSTATPTVETCAFIHDLRLAGLITGQSNAVDALNAYGGVIRAVQSSMPANTALSVGFNICFGNLPSEAAEALDSSFDDGNPATGMVRAAVGSANTTPLVAAPTAGYVSPNFYTVCKLL